MRRIRPAGQTSFTGSPADVGISAVEAAAGGNPVGALAATAAYQAGTTPTDAQWQAGSQPTTPTTPTTPTPPGGGGFVAPVVVQQDLRAYGAPSPASTTDWSSAIGTGALVLGAGALAYALVRDARAARAMPRRRRRYA
jgi:hypothetical protein